MKPHQPIQALAMALSLATVHAAPGKPFTDTWESLKQYNCPDWFRDAKFGIWSHWGPQAVPMEGDWYARNMSGEWQTAGEVPLATPAGKIEAVSVLGSATPPTWHQTGQGLEVQLPPQKISPFTIALKISGKDLQPVNP